MFLQEQHFGLLIYLLTISRIFVKYSVVIIKKIKKILGYPIHFVQKVLKKFLINPIIKLLKKVKSNKELLKKVKSNNKIKKKTKFDKKKRIKLKEKEGIL